MSELHRILSHARQQANEVEEKLADTQSPLLPDGDEHPLDAIPKMLFTWNEAAWVTGITVRTLQRYAREGMLRVSRIRGNTRIRREDLDQLAKDNLT